MSKERNFSEIARPRFGQDENGCENEPISELLNFATDETETDALGDNCLKNGEKLKSGDEEQKELTIDDMRKPLDPEETKESMAKKEKVDPWADPNDPEPPKWAQEHIAWMRRRCKRQIEFFKAQEASEAKDRTAIRK